MLDLGQLFLLSITHRIKVPVDEIVDNPAAGIAVLWVDWAHTLWWTTTFLIEVSYVRAADLRPRFFGKDLLGLRRHELGVSVSSLNLLSSLCYLLSPFILSLGILNAHVVQLVSRTRPGELVLVVFVRINLGFESALLVELLSLSLLLSSYLLLYIVVLALLVVCQSLDLLFLDVSEIFLVLGVVLG